MSDAKDLKKQNKQSNSVLIQQTAISVGPIPHSSEFAAYERTLPGSADRILKMAEKAQEMNEYALKASVQHEYRVHSTARIVICLVLLGGFILAIVNRDLAAYSVLIGSLAALLGSLILNRKAEKKG